MFAAIFRLNLHLMSSSQITIETKNNGMHPIHQSPARRNLGLSDDYDDGFVKTICLLFVWYIIFLLNFRFKFILIT